MNFDFVYIGTRSLTVELDNCFQYQTDHFFDVLVDEKVYYENINTNVFSIFNLEPSKIYEITVIYKDMTVSKKIKTAMEYITLDVKKFGAKGDGIKNDTYFIQAAIMAAPCGGRVYFPKGTYFTGPLFLKSNITIEISKDARILGDTDRNNYPILPGMTLTTDEKDEYNLGTWEGNPLDCFASLITGINVENVNIIGPGVIDGNAQNSDWWQSHHDKKIAWRPRLIFLNSCKNITLEGLTLTNSPSWTIHPYFSSGLNFYDLKVINPKDSPNTDGCNPESSDHINMIGINFSVGDDCIALKSGKIFMGRKYKVPSSHIIIRNCIMNFGHGAVVLGSEMSGGIKNVTVNRCIFNKTDRGLRIKTRRGRGKDAVIDGIKFENILMRDVLTPLCINMFYFCDPDGRSEYVYSKNPYPVDERTPYIGAFEFKDIKCEGVNIAAGVFYGLPEQKIKSITLDNVSFKYSDNPESGVPIMMSYLDPMKAKGLIFYNVENVALNDVSFYGNQSEEIEKTFVDSIVRK